MGDIAQYYSGEVQLDAGWSIDRWGEPTIEGVAIVPIRLGQEVNQTAFAYWTSAFMEYPMCLYQHRGNWLRTNGAPVGEFGKNVLPLHIPGPSRKVIYVLTDYMKPAQGVNIDIFGFAVDSGTHSPAVGGADFAIDQVADFVSQFFGSSTKGDLVAIGYWMNHFGSEDDYKSAFLLVSDVVTGYLPQPSVEISNGVVQSDWAYWHVDDLEVEDYPFYAPPDIYEVLVSDSMRQLQANITSAFGHRGVYEWESNPDAPYAVSYHDIPMMLAISAKMYYYNSSVDSKLVPRSYNELASRLRESNYKLAACADAVFQDLSISDLNLLNGMVQPRAGNARQLLSMATGILTQHLYGLVQRPQFYHRWTQPAVEYVNLPVFTDAHKVVTRMSQQSMEKYLQVDNYCPRDDFISLRGAPFYSIVDDEGYWDCFEVSKMSMEVMLKDKDFERLTRHLFAIMAWDAEEAEPDMPLISDFQLVNKQNTFIRAKAFSFDNPDNGYMWALRHNDFVPGMMFSNIVPLAGCAPALLTNFDSDFTAYTVRMRNERNAFRGRANTHLRQVTLSNGYLPSGNVQNDFNSVNLNSLTSLLGSVRF
jgi:hypothetical protein